MRPRFLRSVFLAASVLASLVVPTSAGAGGAVVPLVGQNDPTRVDVRVAVAVSPQGSTRWSEVTVPSYTRVLWLVPARPGASIVWAQDGWLPALEEATAPRILRPSFTSPCDVETTAERTLPWTASATKRQPLSHAVHATPNAVRAAATESGFAISPDLDARIGALYAAGWNLVALEIDSGQSSASSGTLRVSDGGGAAMPLALVGSRSADTRVTAFTIGAGVANVNGAREIDSSALRWGISGSNFVTWRRDMVNAGFGNTWLRESASHAALFDGTVVTGSAPTTSVAAHYLGGTSCVTSAKNASDSDGVVGGSVDTANFSCDGRDDLALALGGLTPRSAVVTRWTGIVARGDMGVDRPLTFDPNATQSQPAIRAGSYERCVGQSGSTPSKPLTPGPTGGTEEESDPAPTVVYVGDGCSGGTTTTTTYEDEEPTTTTSSDDDCSGDTSTSSSDDSAWDSDDSGDSCASDDSSSSSSDSCSGGSSDSSDGWDTSDDMGPSSKKQSLKVRPKHSKSPFSRYALFAVALLLPLRRRARDSLKL